MAIKLLKWMLCGVWFVVVLAVGWFAVIIAGKYLVLFTMYILNHLGMLNI